MTNELEDSFENSDELLYYARRLKFITRRLEFYGRLSIIAIFLIVISLLINYISIFFFSSKLFVKIDFVMASVAINVSALILVYFSLFAFDIENRKGNVLYNELSDELQWNVRGAETRFSERESRPSMAIRVALRSYVENSVLPIFSTSHGAAIAAIFATALALANLLVTLQATSNY